MLLLLVLIAWLPVSAAGAREMTAGLATPITATVQATPTVDATVTALNKEKLTQDVSQQQHTLGNWLWSSAAPILSTFFSTLIIVTGALIGFRQWRGNQRTEQEKRAEERFQAAVTGLGDDKEGARIGAAILLRTFLRPGYEEFYTQTFDLAVANLRLPRTSNPAEDPNTPLPITTLSQALTVVFKEAFPLARSQNEEGPQFLDATGIQLDNAYLGGADLEQVWMQRASLRKANLTGTNLMGAFLSEADLRGTKLNIADLTRADLRRVKLVGAELVGTNLTGAFLSEADLRGAILVASNIFATKSDASSSLIRIPAAKLNMADLAGADLTGTDLRGVNLEDALSLEDTDLRGVKGLTKEQLETCKAKGAIIDEDSTISSSQSIVSTPPRSPLKRRKAQSTPPAQESRPTPDTGDSSAPSSKPGP